MTHDDAIAKHIDAIKGIISALDPAGEIKVTRTEALERLDRARIANKRGGGDYDFNRAAEN